MPYLVKITRSRGRLCKELSTESGLKIHILETSKLEHYKVDDIGLKYKDDIEVLKLTLAAASQKIYLVTADRHFEDIMDELKRRYPDEAGNIKIVNPSELLEILRDQLGKDIEVANNQDLIVANCLS